VSGRVDSGRDIDLYTVRGAIMDVESQVAGLETRLRRLEDKDEIAELAARYCVVVDEHDAAGLRSLFTDDARFHYANGVADGQGIDGVMQVLAGRWDTIQSSLHVTHGHMIELDPVDPDGATGVLFSHAEVTRNGQPMLSAVRYDDRYRRADGQWCFAERMLSFYYYVEVASYVDDLLSGTPVNAGPTPLVADIPER
jgi:ketosteroid isomerase-like protein